MEGKACRVKTTIKRYNDANVKTKAYSYEVTEIELLDGTLEAHTQRADSSSTSNNSITAAKLLNNAVNSKGKPIINSSKIVDENGEPKVVWHGGGFGQSEESYVWDAEGSGGWFSTTKDYAKGYMRTEEGEPTPLSFEEWKEKNGGVSFSVKEGRLTKNLVEENFGGIWIEDKKEFAKFASAIINNGIEENGEGVTYTDNFFYAYCRNINGDAIPFASVY